MSARDAVCPGVIRLTHVIARETARKILARERTKAGEEVGVEMAAIVPAMACRQEMSSNEGGHWQNEC